MTNISGVGALQLVQSLLPELLDISGNLEKIYVNDKFSFALNESRAPEKISIYRRMLPNFISRFLECVFLSKKFDGDSTLLVLGDLPLRVNCGQVVFVQTPHLVISQQNSHRFIQSLKFAMSRWVFRHNIKHISHCIVQTSCMQDSLERAYPSLCGKIDVVPNPVPTWLVESGVFRRDRSKTGFLNLIYPAASYPHKNHQFLSEFKSDCMNEVPVNSLVLTIDPSENPNPRLNFLKTIGPINHSTVIDYYSQVDGLLFLSNAESLGFPLLEAMYANIPIICPDLPYARSICGEYPIYYSQSDIGSLLDAINTLYNRLSAGWWPDGRMREMIAATTWKDVARDFASIIEASSQKTT